MGKMTLAILKIAFIREQFSIDYRKYDPGLQTYAVPCSGLDDKVIVDQPLVALEDVPLGGFFKRLWDTLTLFFAGLFS